MRVAIIILCLLILPACTSMLLGNASSGDGVATDNRSRTQIAVDNTIAATIRQQLSADPMVSEYTIGIRTIDNAVILSGSVGSYEARDRAVRIANDTDGVEFVRNEIWVDRNL